MDVKVEVKNVKTTRVDWSDPRNVYCGRGRKDQYELDLGNPYPMKRGEDMRVWRERVCNLVAQDVTDALRIGEGELYHKLSQLHLAYIQQGELTLWCYCAPQRCHADEYKRAVQALDDEMNEHFRSQHEGTPCSCKLCKR